VTATGTKVTIVQNVFSLLVNQTSPKDGVNTTAIQGVANDEITTRVVTNASTLFVRNVGLKTLGLKVEKNVSIPRIGGADVENRLIRERISRFNVFIDMRESTDNLYKHQGFFVFGLRKLDIEFLKNNDPFRISTPKYLTCQDVVHGVGVCDHRGGA
jgi:hypothetical protein